MDTAPRRARADGDNRAGFGRHVVDDLDGGAAPDHAVDAVLLGRNCTFDDADVLARVRLHRRLEGGFRLMTGGRKERFVIVEGDQVENEFVDPGVRGAQQRFRAARTLLELQPDDRRLRSPLGRVNEILGRERAESDGGGGHRAEANEVAAVDFPGARRIE